MASLRNKKAQIALFVIIAIVIVAIIFVLILAMRNAKVRITANPESDVNVRSYIEICSRRAVEEAVDIMLPQGGFINPENYKLYNDTKIAYLCQNIGNFMPCINQHPMYLNDLKKEIKDYIMPKIELCFSDLQIELEDKQNQVDAGLLNLEIGFAPDRIFLNIDRKLTISKQEQVRTFNDFKAETISPLYNLALVAIEIASQESKYCYFEYVGYMILYPEIGIQKFAMSDSTKIYGIEDKNSGKKLNIAVRGCAIPAGI